MIGDVFRADRKKIAILTHVQTLISFIFPYSEVGGGKNVLELLPIHHEEYLKDNDLDEFVDSMIAIFNQPHIFTKTENRKVLGHMNDFKRTVLCSLDKTPEELLKDSLNICITVF